MQNQIYPFCQIFRTSHANCGVYGVCIETQTLKGTLTAMYFVLTGEILPTGAGQGEEDFSTENASV